MYVKILEYENLLPNNGGANYELCTSAELKAMSQRLVVAKMLTEKKVYTEIVKETGASTATISRVKRALFDNDTYGYTLVLDRIPKEDK